ncbi:vitamin K epoxide reductase family protein [Rhodopirellula baltica]|uniref:Suppressor for copper-sensitivity C-like protein n=1 Tax=Rhodopirellula baltica WH47 TaxID=991778 RepID=F2B135_RHOBT|nr:vitamin K epoxide reductase family protein [Rhodopirellula baltica]EGF24387.1 suppressor for copper-sensitivity C-like protein [Rhodopirellula baltica WH47]
MIATVPALETDRLQHRSTSLKSTNSKLGLVPLSFFAATTTLAAIALLLSGYLAYVGFMSSQVVGCDGGLFNCDHVLTTRWAKIFGVPVSMLAVTLYLVVIVAIGFLRSGRDSFRRIASTVMMASAAVATTAAVWFISIQVFTIGHLCPYCLVVHACGVLLLALMLWQYPSAWIKTGYSMTVGVVAGVALIAVQAFTPAPQTFMIETNETLSTPVTTEPFAAPITVDGESKPNSETKSKADNFDAPVAMLFQPLWFATGMLQIEAGASANATPRLVPVSGGRKTLDARKWPVWGNVDGKYVIAEMFDYTCEHCRNTHRAVRDAKAQLGGDFGVVMLPVPLHRSCNDAATSNAPERADACEIAALAVSVWLIDPTKFTELHDWLFAQARTATEAKAQAETLVGKARLSQELAKGTAAKYIAKNIILYKDAGAGTVPKIIFPTTTLVGEVGSGSTIAEFARR